MNSYFLLRGLPIESILKAILVSRNPAIVREKVDWKKRLGVSGHNLVGLFTETELPLSDDNCEILKFLQECVEWLGKYPTCLQHNDDPGWSFALPGQCKNHDESTSCPFVNFDASTKSLYRDLAFEYLTSDASAHEFAGPRSRTEFQDPWDDPVDLEALMKKYNRPIPEC